MGDIKFGDAGARVEVDERAPVVGAAEIVVDAPIAAVWGLLSDIPRWPDWNKAISGMSLAGPVEAGTTFRWVGGGWRIASRLEEVEAPRRIAWSGRTMGIRALHVYELTEEGGRTRVRTRESFAGLAARLLRGRLKKALVADLEAGLAALKAAAELARPGTGG